MIGHLLPITALLAGVSLLLLGNGLLGTLLAVRGSLEGYGEIVLGLIGSGYFAGYLAGTWFAPALVRRIGHIRAFAFFAAGFAATALMHGLMPEPLTWIALRMAAGAALVSLYTIIESWLNSHAESATRGRLFAAYMVVNLLSLAAAQPLLTVASPSDGTLFALSALFVCLAVMPVAATRLTQPQAAHAAPFALRRLLRTTPVAAAGSLLSGVAMGAFWSMGAVYAARIGLDEGGVALFMSAGIIGGALLQWPLGIYSDRRDRRAALAAVAAAAALSGLPLAAFEPLGRWVAAAVGLYGGFAFAVYPIAVAHLIDHLEPPQIVGASSRLLLLHGIGAASGPLLAGVLMSRFGPGALAAHFFIAHALLAVLALISVRRGADPVGEPAHFMPMLRTSPTVMEIMPAPEAAQHEHRN